MKYSWISDIEYDPWGNSNFLLDVGADILNVLFLYEIVIFFHVLYMIRFAKGTYLSFLFNLILSLWEPDVLLFLEFINIASIFVL